jgi:hypothetical protein
MFMKSYIMSSSFWTLHKMWKSWLQLYVRNNVHNFPILLPVVIQRGQILKPIPLLKPISVGFCSSG